MCPWSERQSCDPEVHRVCPSRKNPVYNISILWPCCGTFHPSIWLSSHSGATFPCYSLLPLCRCFSFYYYWSITFLSFHWSEQLMLPEGSGALWQSKDSEHYDGWDHAICLHFGTRPIWKLCYSSRFSSSNFSLFLLFSFSPRK